MFGKTLSSCGADMGRKEDVVAEVDRLLVDLEEGSGEYEKDGADGFLQLQEWKYGNGRRMLDMEQTKLNVKDYIRVLRYAITEVKNWRIVDMMLYPVPGNVATPCWDDPLTYAAKKLKDIEEEESKCRSTN